MSLSRILILFLLCLLFACANDLEDSSALVDAASDVSIGDMSQPGTDMNTVTEVDSILPVEDAGVRDAVVPVESGCESWSSLDSQRLVDALHEHLVVTYTPIRPTPNFGGMPDRYTTARQMMFTQVYRFEDEEGAFVIQCIYTNDRAFSPPDRDPDDDLINCEHLFPRARLNSDRSSRLYEHQQSDIHHLAPTRPTANSLRGSFKFGEVVRDRNLNASPSVAGKDSRGEQVFEPQDEVKGDIARAIFYMSIRWGLTISSDEEAVLRGWHSSDGVAPHELAKNDVIEGLQGNRNPFIDCPNLVERVVDFEAFDSLDTVESLPFP